MSTNKSEHLNLHLWEPEDDFLRTEFNENFAALDGAMAAETAARIAAVQAEQEARASALQEVQNSISATGGTAAGAVEQLRTDLTAEIETVQAAADAAQATADNAYCPENKPYVIGSYKGTGTYGKNNPTTLTLGFQPSVLIVSAHNGNSILAIHPQSSFSPISLSWTDDGVSWYSSDSADRQLNTSSVTYFYVAFR